MPFKDYLTSRSRRVWWESPSISLHRSTNDNEIRGANVIDCTFHLGDSEADWIPSDTMSSGTSAYFGWRAFQVALAEPFEKNFNKSKMAQAAVRLKICKIQSGVSICDHGRLFS